MPTRPCLGLPGKPCGRLTQRPDSRCEQCASEHGRRRDQRRGNRHQRGYGSEHDRRRTGLLARLVPGSPCPRCGEPMWPHQELDAGHPIGSPLRLDRGSKADHLSHAHCNRGAND